MARSEGFEPLALVFSYGQRHRVEVARASAALERSRTPWRLQEIDLRAVGGSALTSDAIGVPKGRSADAIPSGGIPPTYVPARNTIFLAWALAWAEVEGIDDIFIGVNALDYSGYPDCRPEYLEAFERLANLASRRTTEGGHRLRIHAPLLRLTKAGIIREGEKLGVDWAATWSCYDPQPSATAPDGAREWLACGACDSCLLRRKGFEEAGVPDPTLYA